MPREVAKKIYKEKVLTMKDKKFEFIIIGVLIILIGYFGYKYYMNDGNRELIKRLEQEEKNLKEERRLNKLQIDSLKNANSFIVQEKNKLEQEVKKDSLLIIQYKSEAKKSTEELEKERKEYEQILKDIDAIKTNPPNRVDDALLKSLREHLNKRMKK